MPKYHGRYKQIYTENAEFGIEHTGVESGGLEVRRVEF